MPRYTYTCPDCGATKTVWRRVAERDSLVECPFGGPDPTMTRDITGPAFHLKGKSWAKDGYNG